MNDLWVVGLAGAAVGGALGWPLMRWAPEAGAVTRDGPKVPVRLLGAMLLLGAIAVGLIAADHSERLAPGTRLVVEHVVYAGNLIFWALLVIWIRTAVGLETRDSLRTVLIAAPLVAYAIYVSQSSAPPRFVWLLPVGTAATIYVCALWIRSDIRQSALPEHALLTRIVVFAVALNTAQTIRTFWPHVDAVREIVPITMTAGFLSIAALAMRALFGTAPITDTATSPRYAKSALDDATAERLLDDLEHGMRDEHWYRDPHLSLAALAAKLDARPHAVSQVLNQVKGCSLNEYLAVWRVAEARRLLADSASDRFTIDALAESAGFASRSAFYKSFKALEGTTPTAFRAQARRQSRAHSVR